MSNNIIWLIGAGPMAIEYAKVLKGLKKKFICIGRGEKSALKFKQETGADAETGGLEKFIASKPEIPDFAILATPVLSLAAQTRSLIKLGVANILVEKPGAIDPSEINDLVYSSSKVRIAYNRRFFASVIELKKRIEEDGGLSSFHFEFTEWSHVIEKLNEPEEVMKNWLLCNSSHVIDLAFHVAGTPRDIFSQKSGSLSWHPSASSFSGCGKTYEEIPFTYFADWKAPGRWSLEFMTEKNRFILKPMEKLQVQRSGSVKIEEIEIDDKEEAKFKPGLYKMLKTFLDDPDHKDLLSLKDQFKNMKRIYNKINCGSGEYSQLFKFQ